MMTRSFFTALLAVGLIGLVNAAKVDAGCGCEPSCGCANTCCEPSCGCASSCCCNTGCCRVGLLSRLRGMFRCCGGGCCC